MLQYLLSTWRSGFRGRSIQGVLIFGLLLVGAAYLAASFSPRQPRTVALDVGLSGLRFSLVLFALFWVQELVAREIERRTVVLALTYPHPRVAYLVGRYLGIFGLLGLAALLLGMLLWLVVMLAGGTYDQQFPVALGLPFWLSIVGLWLDAALVAAFALCIATLSTVPMLPLALGAAFAVAGKSLGAVADYLAKGADGQEELVSQYLPVVEIIHWILPDLSRLDWRAWPMYGMYPGFETLALSTLMGIAYITLLTVLAAANFSRREFF
jgi:Cu-processing system permease protein